MLSVAPVTVTFELPLRLTISVPEPEPPAVKTKSGFDPFVTGNVYVVSAPAGTEANILAIVAFFTVVPVWYIILSEVEVYRLLQL